MIYDIANELLISCELGLTNNEVIELEVSGSNIKYFLDWFWFIRDYNENYDRDLRSKNYKRDLYIPIGTNFIYDVRNTFIKSVETIDDVIKVELIYDQMYLLDNIIISNLLLKEIREYKLNKILDV